MAAAMSSRIRVGVVGLSTQGWASWGLIPPLLKLDNSPYEIVATCTSRDKSPDEVSILRSKYGKDLKVYSDIQEIANSKEIDLVIISVKAPDHLKTIQPLLSSDIEKKKDIFIEWPACSSAKSCLALAQKAEKLGIRISVGLQGRHSPSLKKVHEIVNCENGEKGIGKIISSSITGCSPLEIGYWGPRVSQSASYIADIKNGATMLHVMIGHLMDQFLRIFGDISTVSTTQTVAFPESTVIDASGATTSETVQVTAPDQLAFSGLTTSNILYSFHYRAGLSMTEGRTNFVWHIDGTEGSLRLEGNGNAGSFLNIMEATVYLNGKQLEITQDPLGKVGRAWSEFTKGTSGDCATIGDAIRVHKVLDAVMESGEQKRQIQIS